jgi:GntR family transcriptional regulator
VSESAKETQGKARQQQRNLVAGLRALIVDGDVAPGEPLPSSTELSRRYGVNAVSISRAMSILEAEGLVDRQKGRGVFATDRGPKVVRANHFPKPADGAPYGWITEAGRRGRHGHSELLGVAEVPAPRPVAAVFGLDAGGLVVARYQLLHLDDEPAELVCSYYTTDLARGTALAEARLIKGGSPRVLADLGVPLRNAKDKVGVRMATKEEYELLRLPADIPVLRQFRVVFTDNQRPIEVTVMVKAGQQYEVEYDLPESI